MSLLRLDPAVRYRELRAPRLDPALRALAEECFAAQREVVLARDGAPAADEAGARDAVSDETLAALLRSGRRIGGIADQRDIATAVPFNVPNVEDVLWSKRIVQLRRRLDAALAPWLVSLFDPATPALFFPAGHWWYPAGTCLGWHTNERFPGWRLYLSHATHPGRSCFRYRDPASGAISTSLDESWDVRFFLVTAEDPLWHAVYAGADRFSIGWIVRPWSPWQAALHTGRRLYTTLRGRA